MVRLAEVLLEYESLDGVQIRRIVAGLPIDDTGSISRIGNSAGAAGRERKEPRNR